MLREGRTRGVGRVVQSFPVRGDHDRKDSDKRPAEQTEEGIVCSSNSSSRSDASVG